MLTALSTRTKTLPPEKDKDISVSVFDKNRELDQLAVGRFELSSCKASDLGTAQPSLKERTERLVRDSLQKPDPKDFEKKTAPSAYLQGTRARDLGDMWILPDGTVIRK